MNKRQIKSLIHLPKVVYHGSSIEHQESLKKIRVDVSRKDLDFGRGFYTTSVKKQAIEWAKGKSYSANKPLLLTYKIHSDIIKLKGKHFVLPDEEWARSIYENRLEMENQLNELDYAYGHLADGFMLGLLEDIMKGVKNFDDFKKEVFPTNCQKFYYDQLVFKTEKSLEMLTLVKEEVLQ